MDFKSRFAGKMTKLDSGGIEKMVETSNKPIQEVDKITIKSLYPASDNEGTRLHGGRASGQTNKSMYGQNP